MASNSVPVKIFRSVPASSFSFFRSDGSYKLNLKLKTGGHYRAFMVREAFKNAYCPYLPATCNLTRLLNWMDDLVGIRPSYTPMWRPCHRWEVMEDAKALHIVRNMAGLPNKDVVTSVFSGKNVMEDIFGCVNVYQKSSSAIRPRSIDIKVGKDGPQPGSIYRTGGYRGYAFEIYLSDKIYEPSFAQMDVKNEILKISIPKEKGKWIGQMPVEVRYIDD